MIYITHRRMSPPNSRNHEHITHVAWMNPATNNTGENSVADIVDFIRNKKGVAKVTDGESTVDVSVVDTNPPHIRTVADGNYTNNLLALPEF